MVRAWSRKTPNKAALIDGGRGLIAGYKVPKEIHLTGGLPQTATGKVQKETLRQQLRGERPWAISRYSRTTSSPVERS
jgi:acyl-CoA synthetase (AMP-forming)/AMP-acid ligase II